jgi:hypothetical protein
MYGPRLLGCFFHHFPRSRMSDPNFPWKPKNSALRSGGFLTRARERFGSDACRKRRVPRCHVHAPVARGPGAASIRRKQPSSRPARSSCREFRGPVVPSTIFNRHSSAQSAVSKTRPAPPHVRPPSPRFRGLDPSVDSSLRLASQVPCVSTIRAWCTSTFGRPPGHPVVYMLRWLER